jgi:PAS domain S-box-containing protein
MLLRRARTTFWSGAGSAVALILTIALLLWVNGRATALLTENDTASRLARDIRVLVLDRETGVRGFLMSRQQTALAPAVSAQVPLSRKLDSLVAITADNASQQDRAKAIGSAIYRWERGWVAAVLTDPSTLSDGSLRQRDLAGKELFDSIRSAFDSFAAGQAREAMRAARMASLARLFGISAMIVELMLLLGLLAWASRRAISQTQQVMLQQKMLEDAERTALIAKSRQQESESLLEFALNESPVGVSLRDSDLKIVRVNASMTSILGFGSEDPRGKAIDEVVSDEMADILEPAMKRVLATGVPITNVPLHGSTRAEPDRDRHFMASLFPVLLPGNAKGVGSVLIDTTQYRELEDQLAMSQKMEAVGRLAGGVAHDFNNMLTAIMSYSELILAEMDPSSPQRADMMEIVNAAERATGLTRKLLAFSRQQVLRPTLVDLNRTLTGLEKMLNRLASPDIEITYRFADKLWTVAADPTELERVITNLVLNSRDAMPDGGSLIVETSNVTIDEAYTLRHAETAPGEYVMLAVNDTGVGMTKEVREKLFEPFFTTKEKAKGTGLGLPSVYGIVKQSGGFVWVYSEVGRGTTFKVYLPRAQGEAVSPVAQEAPSAGPGSETILFVEDDDEVREIATRILRKNGYRVLEAANGADALRVCEAEARPVDLIVTDIVMPEMGGSQLAERIRETQPDARILFTSGYTEDAAVRHSFIDPGEEFIGKPFTPSQLTQKTRDVLDATRTEKIT